jgi:hypothetical protein
MRLAWLTACNLIAGTVLYPLLGSNNTVAGQAVVPGGFQPLRSDNGSSPGSASSLPTTEVSAHLQQDSPKMELARSAVQTTIVACLCKPQMLDPSRSLPKWSPSRVRQSPLALASNAFRHRNT